MLDVAPEMLILRGVEESGRAPRYVIAYRYGRWYLLDAPTGAELGPGQRCHAAVRALAARLNAEVPDLAAHRWVRDARFRCS